MDEYKEHIDDKRCRAGKCKNFVALHDRQNQVCRLYGLRPRLANAIAGERKQPHAINNETCICGQCYEIASSTLSPRE